MCARLYVVAALVALMACVACGASNQNYKTIPLGNYNWFVKDLPKSAEGVCPEGTRIPSEAEWVSVARDKFLGKSNKKTLKSFVGASKGYYMAGDTKKKIKNKNVGYFSVNGSEKVLMLDPKNSKAQLVKVPAGAVVSVRCISDRNFFEELNISQKDNMMTDPRDGKKYPVMIRDGKAWMTSNLKFNLVSASQCFLEDQVFCKKHGRFFTYNDAKKACPKGWHLPDDGEWRDFQLDWSKLDWKNLGQGGCKDWDEYCDEATTGHYWSATSVKRGTGRAWEFRSKARSIDRTDADAQKLLYVRCVADMK